MRRVLAIGGALAGLTLLVLLFVANHYRAERYQIVHAVFLSRTNVDILGQPAVLCYSNQELTQAVKMPEILSQAGMNSFSLDGANLIACVVSNYTVERVVGRGDFGLIIQRKSQTNGISFTIFKGTKRFLQFSYPEER